MLFIAGHWISYLSLQNEVQFCPFLNFCSGLLLLFGPEAPVQSEATYPSQLAVGYVWFNRFGILV